MSPSDRTVDEVIAHAASRRGDAGTSVGERLDAIIRAAVEMSSVIATGGTLCSVGAGVSRHDAAHVAVEFVHPVIVGKRSVPALRIGVGDSVRAGDVVLALRHGREPGVERLLETAGTQGAVTVDLASGTDLATPPSRHHVHLDEADHHLGRELQVTVYHLLWELVHEVLDGGPTGDSLEGDLGGLYPFLATDGGAPSHDHLREATAPKLDEIRRLRVETIGSHAATLGAAATAIRSSRGRGGTVWLFGNGGSSTDAQALAHLLSSPTLPGSPVTARALTDDVATVTALANDVSFDVVFARMLRSLARRDDVAVGLSTSGGSTNVLDALDHAHDLGLTTIGFAGYDGGPMAELDALDHLFVVPSSSVHRIQEAQTSLAHVLIEAARSD